MGNNWFNQKHHGILLSLLLPIAYFLLMFGNGFVSLTHPDEVFYIQSAKEMLEHNSWLTPRIFGEVQFEKPFLSFTLFMTAIKWFGLNSFAARFWPGIFGVLGVGIVYWISWMLFSRKRLSFFAGLILCSNFIYLALSRAVLTDMIFSIFVTLALGMFYFAYSNRKHKNLGILGCFMFAAIAVLTKGFLGVLFPMAGILIFLIYKKDIKFLICPATVWGTLLFLILSLPWHILMYNRHGQLFLEEYFYNVHWRRILASEHARLDNWYFYIMMMFVGVTPWFLFWIPAAQTIFMQFKKKMASRDKLFFLLAWIISIYIFVQPAHSKLASYLFPVFPAIAIILAFGINELLDRASKGRDPQLFKICGYIMPVVLIGIAIGGTIAGKKYIDVMVDMRPIYLAACLLTLVAFLIFSFNRKKLYTQMVISFVGVTATVLISIYFMKPYIEPWVSCKEVSDVFNKMDTGSDPVISSKFYVRGVRYYTEREMIVMDINGKGFWSPHPIPFLEKDHIVQFYLDDHPIVWAIVKEGNFKDFQRILRHEPNFKIHELYNKGGKYILKIEKIS